MRRVVIVGLVLGLLAGALTPAEAAKKKKKKKKPVPVTFYMHGPSQLGEVDGVQWVADGLPNSSPLTMDTTEPTGSQTKSMNYFSPPFNDQCTGLPLAFPTFVGKLKGTIVRDATMTAYFTGAPATVTARIWADVLPFQACNDEYIEPAAEVQAEVAAGDNAPVEFVFPKLKLVAKDSIMIEILVPSGAGYRGQVGRLLYDSASSQTKLDFKCLPRSGKSCV